MKKCTYCGKEYPDDTTVCALDEQRLERVGPPPVSQANVVPKPVVHPNVAAAVHAVANKNMLFGGLWCFGGILVTALTYSAATGGGTYVVAWGAIVFGGIQFFRGLLAKSRI